MLENVDDIFRKRGKIYPLTVRNFNDLENEEIYYSSV